MKPINEAMVLMQAVGVEGLGKLMGSSTGLAGGVILLAYGNMKMTIAKEQIDHVCH